VIPGCGLALEEGLGGAIFASEIEGNVSFTSNVCEYFDYVLD